MSSSSFPEISEKELEQIIKEIDPQLRFNSKNVLYWTLWINFSLPSIESVKASRSLPTPDEVRKHASKISAALTKLRALLPDPNDYTNPLLHYLEYCGDNYAEEFGAHKNIEPKKLDDNWPAHVKGLPPRTNAPRLIDYRSELLIANLFDSVEAVGKWLRFKGGRDPFEIGIPARIASEHRTLTLIGSTLPAVYEEIFRRSYGVSRTELQSGSLGYGPGVRFVLRVLEEAGVTSMTDEKFSAETIIRYRTTAKQQQLADPPSLSELFPDYQR
jgi:hypothetical protein